MFRQKEKGIEKMPTAVKKKVKRTDDDIVSNARINCLEKIEIAKNLITDIEREVNDYQGVWAGHMDGERKSKGCALVKKQISRVIHGLDDLRTDIDEKL